VFSISIHGKTLLVCVDLPPFYSWAIAASSAMHLINSATVWLGFALHLLKSVEHCVCEFLKQSPAAWLPLTSH